MNRQRAMIVYNYEIGMGGVGIGTPFVADQRPRTLLEHARGRLYQMIEPVKRSMAVRSLDYEVQMKNTSLCFFGQCQRSRG